VFKAPAKGHFLGEHVHGTFEPLALNAGTSAFTRRTGTLYASARILGDENLLFRAGRGARSGGAAGCAADDEVRGGANLVVERDAGLFPAFLRRPRRCREE
jgi:hypothetical protein